METSKKSFLDSKFMTALRGFGEKLGANKGFSAVSKSMMGLMAVILVGAVFQLAATIPTLFGWFTAADKIYTIIYAPYNMTMGLMSVFIVFMIAYNYSKSLGMKPIQNGLVALICFLSVSAPITSVTLADGSTTMNVLDSSNLGATGMFVAILIGILTVKLTHFCEKHNIIIRMPEVVPPFLSDSFSAMLPLLFNLIVWYGVSTALSAATGGQMSLPLLVTYILSIPISAVDSVPGMLIITVFACFLWIFGIHGTMVAYIALMAVMMQNLSANAAAVAAGEAPQFYATMLFGAIATAGGTGDTFGLVLRGFRCKSEQIRAVSKAAIVPGLFGINEPATFGYPIMYNPILAVPYILTPLITMLILWLGYLVGFFKPSYVTILSLMPMGVGEFLGAMAWQNIFIPVVGIVVGYFVFAPFLNAYDKELYAKEQALKAGDITNAE
ncbi:MAG: PTS transporter subunit EIIC [Clostridiales bacterium]|jgi:PTS system cellobiose-specific IIC component|nr:PTS transporter subunit EIIC [Clostridiales bacterium]